MKSNDHDENMSAATNTKTTASEEPLQNESKLSRVGGPTGIAVAAGIGVLLLVGGTAAGFFAGRVVDSKQDGFSRDGDSNRLPSQNGQTAMGSGMPGGMRGMLGGLNGEVTAVSATSITLTDSRSGGSVTFGLNDDTEVTNNDGDDAAIGDVKVGDTVAVTGTTADDDLLAGSIVIDPTLPAMRQ